MQGNGMDYSGTVCISGATRCQRKSRSQLVWCGETEISPQRDLKTVDTVCMSITMCCSIPFYTTWQAYDSSLDLEVPFSLTTV
jgi:hypothetical protein